MNIRTRLIIGFSGIILIFLIAIAITLFNVTTTKNFANDIIENDLPTYDRFIDLGSQIHMAEASLRGVLLTNSVKYKNELDIAWNNIARIQATLDDLSKNWADNDLLRKWQEVKTLLSNLKETQIKSINTQSETNKAAQIPLLMAEVDTGTDKILDIIDGPVTTTGERIGGIFDTQYATLQNGTEKIISDMRSIEISEYILSLLGIFTAILVSIYTARSILRHINVFRQFSSKIASGDLRQFLAIQGTDEIGQLGNDLNSMTQSLSGITKQITQVCQNMVTSLEEVKQAVNSQSSGATEQASSINEITASLEEIEKSSTQTMEKAKALGVVAERTREKGQLGLEAVDQSIQGMKAVREKVQIIAQTILDLSNQTQQVGEITAVVNTLAQQSKMLALNASIEAAKAGDAGKGFAVVATEVKNLAEQSEQSTTQVQKILEDIRHATEKAVLATEEGTKGVDNGTDLVEQTGEVVRSLSDVIHEATVASQQIEAAIRQEGVGIEQITAGMNEINQVTSSFVASVKQTTEAIDNLAKITKNLKEYVDVYKV